MAADAGRNLRIKYDSGGGSVVIAGARADTITTAVETIDITDKDDAGVVTLLDDIATKGFSLSVEGVLKDTVLLVLAHAATAAAALHDFEILITGLGTYAGSFAITNFESAGSEGTDPMTFSCALTSSGAVTFVAT